MFNSFQKRTSTSAETSESNSRRQSLQNSSAGATTTAATEENLRKLNNTTLNPATDQPAESSFLSQLADKLSETGLLKSPDSTQQHQKSFLTNLFTRFTAQQQQSSEHAQPRNAAPEKDSNSMRTLGNSEPQDVEMSTRRGDEQNSESEQDSYDSFDSRDEYDEDEDEDEVSEEEVSWVEWFCSLSGHEFFVEVDEDFIDDDFNLTGLSSIVPYYTEALEMIQDTGPEGSYSKEEIEEIEAAAELLYALIHQRFLVTKAGLSMLYEKFTKKGFGVCPRTLCEGQGVLPVGMTDAPQKHSVKLFCPRCLDIYQPPSTKHHSVDGCAFGTTAAHLILLSVAEYKESVVASWRKSVMNTFDSVGVQETGIYIPKIYGFKINSSSPAGAKMRWLRQIRTEWLPIEENNK